MNNAEVKKFIDDITQEYIDNHTKEQERDELIGENNRIKQDREGYHGREIFELLQNADDAYQKSINEGKKPKDELEVSIIYKNGVLCVNNTGTSFDKKGIIAIVQGNNSPKTEGLIGNKGTGFRSLLNWATKIIIHSGEYHVEFSKKIAQQKFNEIKDSPQIKKQLKEKNDLYIPMFAVPQYISNCESSTITRIEITINTQNNDNDSSVKQQLEEIDIRILLFLPNIHKININIDNDEIAYEKSIDKNKIIELKKIKNNSCQINEKFFLYEKNCLAIAVPVDFTNFAAEHLYSYFPLLNITSPFNCILHANYDLDANRNAIVKTPSNEEIIKNQLNLLIEIAEKFIANNDFESAYTILLPLIQGELFSRFEVKTYYFDKLSSAKIFPTVNNELFSIEDNPLELEDDYPSVFKGEQFSRLLNPIKNENGKKLFKKLYTYKNISTKFEESNLLEAINANSENWNIENQVRVFIWWNKHYDNYLPNLIKTQNGRFLAYKEECYFITGNSEKLLFPSWVTIPIIDKTYQEILFNLAEQNPDVIEIKKRQKNDDLSRIISQNNIFPCVTFKYRDIHTVIGTINGFVDSFDKAVDFVNWLWTHYADNESLRTHKDTLNFPCCFKNGVKSFSDRKKIFYGKDYGNELGEQLFCSDNDFIFPDRKYFNIINSDKLETFVDFLKTVGVKQYPVIELKELENEDSYSTYYMSYKKVISEIANTTSLDLKFKLLLIDNLSEILQTVSTENIIKWIINDKNLFMHLSNPYETNNARIEYKTYRQQYVRHYNGTIKNYTLEVFNNTKWITIGKEKFSPRDILANSNNNNKFIGLTPVIVSSEKNIEQSQSDNVLIIKKLAKDIEESKEKIEEVLTLFDFRKQVTDLSSDKFYEILLNIPHDEIRGKELCRAIYRIVEQADFKKDYTNSDNKRCFFSEGKMFVTFHGKEQFYPANQSFLPTTTIINKKNYPIVIKGARTNNENFIRVFGCQKYEKKLEIDVKNIIKSGANKSFQDYFSEFKKYAKAFDERNANLRENSDKLRITLAKDIPIIENNAVIYVEDEYDYINNSSTDWYIKIPTDNFNSLNKTKLGTIISDIYENIANTPNFDAGKILALFAADNHDDRKIIIENEFGSLDVINNKDSIKELEDNFIETIQKINPQCYIDLDWYEFTETNFKNSQKIIDIFKSLHIDIEEFYKNGFKEKYNINLIHYLKKQLRDFIHDNEDNYINMLYTQALDNEELQKIFLDNIDIFRNFTGENDITNSVNVCIIDIIKKRFPAWNNKEPLINAHEKYQENYDKMNHDKLYSDEISNNKNVQRMIYFNKTEEFNKWINEMKEIEQNNNNKDSYTKISNLVPKKCNIKYSSVTINQQTNNTTKIVSSHSCYTQIKEEKKRKKQKEQGNKGELLIYNYLCEEYGKDKVFPKSEAFIELGIIPAGLAKSGIGYDIEYKDENNVSYFVEVKTGHNNTFYITLHELQFAQENWERYKLFYVFDLDTDEPNFNELPQKFWENKKYRYKEIIEHIEIKF